MNCQRCYSTDKITTGSYFNTEMICMKCKEREENHEMYDMAKKEEAKQVRAGNYNFEGIGLPNDLKIHQDSEDDACDMLYGVDNNQ